MLKKIIIGVVTVFFAFCSILIVKQHIRYPRGTQVVYAMQEPFTIGPFQLEVTDVEGLSLTEFCDLYDLHMKEEDFEASYNIQVILVRLRVTNQSENEQNVPVSGVMISSPDYANSIELFSSMDINDIGQEGLVLQPQETREILLPYIEYGDNYGVAEGSLLDQVPLRLSFRLYPEKTVVKLNDLW